MGRYAQQPRMDAGNQYPFDFWVFVNPGTVVPAYWGHQRAVAAGDDPHEPFRP